MKSQIVISTLILLVLVLSACVPLVEPATIDEQSTEDFSSLVETEAGSPEEKTPTATEAPITNANPPTGAQLQFSRIFQFPQFHLMKSSLADHLKTGSLRLMIQNSSVLKTPMNG